MLPSPFDRQTPSLALELQLPMPVVEVRLNLLTDEGVSADDAADWLRAMQRRKATFAAVLEAVRDGQSPSSWTQ